MQSESLRRTQEPAVQRPLTSAELQAQIDEFLSRGGTIEAVPSGLKSLPDWEGPKSQEARRMTARKNGELRGGYAPG